MPRRPLAVLLWLTTFAVLSPPLARAECVIRTASEVLQDPGIEVVFSGTVTSVARTGEYGYRATFAVDRVWKNTTSVRCIYVYEEAPKLRDSRPAGHTSCRHAG